MGILVFKMDNESSTFYVRGNDTHPQIFIEILI